MKIVGLETFQVDGGWESFSFLKILTDEGLAGWSEYNESRRRGMTQVIHGLGAGLNGTLVAGARVLLRERFEAQPVIAALAGGEATMFFGVPTMYVRILEQAGWRLGSDGVRRKNGARAQFELAYAGESSEQRAVTLIRAWARDVGIEIDVRIYDTDKLINLEANKGYVQRTFGDFEFRKFRLYLWGAAYEFLTRNLDCYRLILENPRGA